MDITSAVLSFSPVLSAAYTLIAKLVEIQELKKHNEQVVSEAEVFIKSVRANISMLEEKLPSESGAWAIASLEEDLKKAAGYLRDCLKKGKFKTFWDAKQIAEELETLRKDLAHKFQIKLFITTFEVIIDANRRTEDFHSRMLQLFALSAAHNNAATTEIRQLLQPLVIGLRRQDATFQAFLSGIRQTPSEADFEKESETEKFIADVIANLEELTDRQPQRQGQDDDQEYIDRFTGELMIDPVKCKDGLTYCRFSVFRYNLSQMRPLVILCDDVSVRGRLFERFHDQGLDIKYKARRDAYRKEALRLAEADHCAEALVMLSNVLQWDDSDTKCIQMRQKMEATIATKQQMEIHVSESDRRPPSGIDSQRDVHISESQRRLPSGTDSPIDEHILESDRRPPSGIDSQRDVHISASQRRPPSGIDSPMDEHISVSDRRPPSGIDSQRNVHISESDRRPPSPVEPPNPTRMTEQPSNSPLQDQLLDSKENSDPSPKGSALDCCFVTFCCCPCSLYLMLATYFKCLKWAHT